MIPTAVCNTYIELGVNAQKEGLRDVADRMLEAAFEEAQRLSSRQCAPCAVFNRLALLYYQQGKPDRAEYVYQQAIMLYGRIFDDGDPILVNMILNLAELYFSQRKYDVAWPLYERALRRVRLNKTIEKCALKLAFIYASEQQFDEAHKIYARISAFREERIAS